MKDMLKSKVLVVFVLMVLGVIFIDSSITVRLEDKVEKENYEIVMANIK